MICRVFAMLKGSWYDPLEKRGQGLKGAPGEISRVKGSRIRGVKGPRGQEPVD
jgi:hypothetical protein